MVVARHRRGRRLRGRPLRGFDLPDETSPALFAGSEPLADTTALLAIRSDLPLLIASGSADPLAGGGDLAAGLALRYRSAGLTDATLTAYPDARHEILNEINGEQITAGVISRLDQGLPASS